MKDEEYPEECPYENDKDAHKEVTVEMMIEMLQKVPSHYLVSFDSACGHVSKGGFRVMDWKEAVSING